MTFLVAATGLHYMPVFYLMAIGAISLAVVLTLPSEDELPSDPKGHPSNWPGLEKPRK